MRRKCQRILSWQAAAGVLWLDGGLAHGGAREALWVVAVIIDYAAGMVGFYPPGLGRSRTSDWQIDGGHLLERCQLFLIIALGESILVTGATFGQLRFTAVTVAAFVVAFLGSVALWWVYFDPLEHGDGDAIRSAANPGRLGRLPPHPHHPAGARGLP